MPLPYIVLPNLPSSSEEQSAVNFLKRDLPKISGSSGAFIALIVVLILVIMASCTTVFFVLRHPTPNEEDYISHRQRGRHYLQQPDSPSTFDYKQSDGSEPSTWKEMVGGMFRAGRGSSGPSGGATTGRTRKGGRRGRGWVQTGSGDEGDSGDEDSRWNVMKHLSPTTPHSARHGSKLASSSTPRSGSGSSTNPSFQPPTRQPSARASSIRLDITLPGPMYDDPYTEVLALHTDQPPATVPIPRSTSPETIPGSSSERIPTTTPGNRQYSGHSRTFEGGTKFIESL